jgi:putative ABC transport system permease protein
MAYYNGIRHSIFTRKTDAEYWKILDYTYLEGGPITDEDVNKANFVAVINESTKKKFFGDSPSVGKMITVDNQRFRIKGVVEDVPIVRVLSFSDVWVPLTTEKTDDYLHDGLEGFYMGAMLAESKDDIPAIKEEFKMRLAQMEMPNPEKVDKANGVPETLFETFSRMLTLSVETDENKTGLVISVIIGLMIFFMILPTVNLININMSRILERASEIGVRKAFGASSRRLIMQFIVENLILTMIGGIIGFVLSEVVLDILNGSGLIPYSNFSLNLRIFFYGMVITLFFGVFSGVYPAWKMSRLHPVEALKEGS